MPGPVQSDVIVSDETSRVIVDETAVIQNTVIYAEKNSIVTLGAGVIIDGCEIHVTEGILNIGDYSRLRKAGRFPSVIQVTDGNVEFGHHCVFNAELYARFGGVATIGQYTAIKQGTEIRCEERLTIGDFCMISYECLIWDTNTHQILPAAERRARTIRDFPGIGGETERPKTSPIYIGDDTWVGQRAVILKGSHIGDRSIVGVAALVSGRFSSESVLVGNPARAVG